MSNYKLTELFPHIDDEVIGYVYAQAGGNLEKSINLLLQMVKDSRTHINNEEEDLTKINAEIQRLEEENNIEEKTDEKEVIKKNDRQIAEELHDEILSRTIQDIIMFDYENNQEQELQKKVKKQKIKNKDGFMKKFGKKFSELFSKMSCACYSDINRQGYSNMEDHLDKNSQQDYNIQSYMNDMPNSDSSQQSPESVSPDDIRLFEIEPIEIQDNQKQNSLSEINI
jgi:hypothetical protein